MRLSLFQIRRILCHGILLIGLANPRWADAQRAGTRSWTADNGNGTYSNPLFYDEFSDPDMIRVGSDYYLTGTTMHTMPGLPILHSRDLVNWRIVGYAFERLDLGPDFRLEGGKDIYGQGIWAPSFRYHNGTYYIFANVNRFGLQVFRATDPRGPWKHNGIQQGLHDLSVLFDDGWKIYAVYGAGTIRIVELNAGLTEVVPGTDRVLIERDKGMGEGSHVYKLDGRYYIVSAIPGAHVPMKCARADRLAGPWEVKTISEEESLGIGQGYRLRGGRGQTGPPQILPPDPSSSRSLTLHQGGIIDTPTGEWWGYSMQDHNSVGRLTCLSPVTWVDGWPYFGLRDNLTRTPGIWVKPDTGSTSPAGPPYDRSDDFAGKLKPVWQWNHAPDDTKWSVTERPGYLRLHALAANDFWTARNTLTQRAIGPESTVTTELDASGMKAGDVAGLALLNMPYAWIGVERGPDGLSVARFDQITTKTERERVKSSRLWFRAECNFDTEKALLSYSLDGRKFTKLGGEFTMVFQLRTFQGVRYGLFHFNNGGAPGGYTDFNSFEVYEPRPRGLTKAIPVGRTITFSSLAEGGTSLAVENGLVKAGPVATAFRVIDMGRGSIALRAPDGGLVSVEGEGAAGAVAVKRVAKPGDAQTFQWVDLRGDILLLSLATHRYLKVPAAPGPVSADYRGGTPDRKDGSHFTWK
jgi:beta-xylosidase